MEAVLNCFYLPDILSYCCKIYFHKEYQNLELLEFQGPYGPLKNSSSAGGMLATLAWLLALLEK